MSSSRSRLSVSQLEEAVEDGLVDTVLVVITDMQGRLQGKRCDARFFLDEVAEHATEGCSYLMAVDVDMNTVDGYAMSSWGTGYGDFVMQPDLSSLRMIPWHERSVLCHADLTWEDRAARRALAPPDTAAPERAPGRTRMGWPRRDRARIHRLRGPLRGRLATRLPGHDPGEHLQRRLLDPRHLPD